MGSNRFLNVVLLSAMLALISIAVAYGQVPGGTLDPTKIPKYVTPLVIPPVMPNTGTANNYEIAMRQFKQQILPGGIWNTINGRHDHYAPTAIWSYGPESDKTPAVAPDPNSRFNYPAYTIETSSSERVNVKWVNGLKDSSGRFLPHLLPVDQTLHWANPPQQCVDGTGTDCMGVNPDYYTGPVPMVVHVHGAHVDPHSDGYPEAWWLPAATNIPASYARHGRLFDSVDPTNQGNKGFANFSYRNDQPATTLWYHDHSLGMTRSNVYAGPAGFWLIRGGDFDLPKPGSQSILPGPAPVAGQGVLDLNVPGNPVRNSIREIPIVIQDRSFDENGAKLFYPKRRAFFEGVSKGMLQIDFAPNSDVAPIWNPEAFFNVMVVNGVSWPQLDVARALYRFRLLDGCNSRFLNLSLRVVKPDGSLGQEIPFYQIGAEEGFLKKVVRIKTGERIVLPGDGTIPEKGEPTPAEQALLMANAERADVIVDFRGLPNGTVVRMINTGPDEPFGGFPVGLIADPATTGQVMQFVVNENIKTEGTTDQTATDPWRLVLPAEDSLGNPENSRDISLNEMESSNVCVLLDVDAGTYVLPIKQVDCAMSDPDGVIGSGIDVVPFGPTMAMLGILNEDGSPLPLHWSDEQGMAKTISLQNGLTATVNVTENPAPGALEEWQIHNFTEDAHPIHIHMVRFNVVGREIMGGGLSVSGSNAPQPTETGYKDTIIVYPGEIARVKAKYDIPGLFVWHCHIVEHEDNEMMRPYIVGP